MTESLNMAASLALYLATVTVLVRYIIFAVGQVLEGSRIGRWLLVYAMLITALAASTLLFMQVLSPSRLL
jgi:hypothetical protein